MSLVLYHFESCPYCAKVRAAVKELGVDVEMRDTRAEEKYRDELVELTGRTQVPCLVIDGKPMHESDDIVDWLREKYS